MQIYHKDNNLSMVNRQSICYNFMQEYYWEDKRNEKLY